MATVESLIKFLPLELREKIYKHFVEKKIKEKQEMGFGDIHFTIKNAPYCEKKERITKILMCYDCFHRELCGDCYPPEDICYECSFYPEIINNKCLLCRENPHYVEWEYACNSFFKLI